MNKLIALSELAKRYQHDRAGGFIFPEVGWELTDPEFFSRYKIALRGGYDPESSILWDEVKAERYLEEERIALRYYWSRLALGEYILVLADAKALEQAILQGYPTEIKQAVMMHLRDEWAHTDMTAEYARRLGGILLPPVLLEKHKQFFTERLADLERKLHPTFMRFSFGELTENFAHFGPLRSVKDPVASAIYTHIYTDEMRHGRTNWEWSTRGVGKGIGDVSAEDKAKAAYLIPYGEKARRGWLIWGYHDLPSDEQDFHVESLRLAKKLGHTLFDAEEFLTTYEAQAKINYDKLLKKIGLTIDNK